MKNRSLTALIVAGGLAMSAAVATRTFAEPPATTPTTPATTTQPSSEPGKKHDGPKAERKDKKDEKKAEAKGVKVGDTAPAFNVTDTEGKAVKLEDFKGKTVVLIWFNPSCPGITMHFTKESMTFNKLYEEYNSKGVEFVAVNSGSADKEGGKKDDNVKAKNEWKMQFPIALDTTGEMGRAYGATNTPHVFVINKEGKIGYKGAIDNGSFREGKVGEKNYVKNALDNILASKAADPAETKPYGCPVKYSAK
jgi:peroxiredoxin